MTTEAPESIKRTRFNPGDKAPEWLIAMEPRIPTAVKGDITFQTACDVIDLPDCYIVFPVGFGNLPSIFKFEGSGCNIFAASKQVKSAISVSSFETVDYQHWGPPNPQAVYEPNAPQWPVAPAPMRIAPMQLAPPKANPGLISRIKAFLRWLVS